MLSKCAYLARGIFAVCRVLLSSAMLIMPTWADTGHPPTSIQPPPEASTIPNFVPDLNPTDSFEQNNLGWMYQRGKGGLPLDYTEAARWFGLSAAQGNPYGQANLGIMYESGKGVPHDIAEALKWYQLAAAQGNEYAHKALTRLASTPPQQNQ